jgi:nucleotide-binding universal stress UspA family protein
MYKVIMVPTEGSDLERPAITLAVRLAQRFEAELRLVRVGLSDPVVECMPNAGAYVATAITESRLAQLRYLESLGAECRDLGGIRVITALEAGPVAPTLKDYAARFNVDLIVMASHARGGVSRIALGSVADYLIRRAEMPVIVVKAGMYSMTKDPNRTFNRIVVALDGSRRAEQILPQVVDVASRLQCTVNLLRVLTPQTYSQKELMQPGLPWWDADIAAANDYLARVAAPLTEKGLLVSKDVLLSENVSTAILDYATRTRADLIALTTRGEGGIGRFVFGSVADEITRRSAASLLVLRAVSEPALEAHIPDDFLSHTVPA